MVEQDRTCYLWNRSRVSYLETIEAVSRLILFSFSDVKNHYLYLCKRDCHGWARTLDLLSHEPAWSLGAMEARGCRDTFSELVFISLEGLRAFLRYVVNEALHEHVVK